MVFILCCLIAREICLCVVFLEDRLLYSQMASLFPVCFKYLMVLYVCRFKLNIYYVTEQKKAPGWVRPSIFVIEVASVIVNIFIPIGSCFIPNEDMERLFHWTTELVTCVAIMILSLYFFSKIFRKMDFGVYRPLRKWLLALEILM